MKKKLSRNEKEDIVGFFAERFGLSADIFKGLGFFKTKKKFYMATQECLSDPLFIESEAAGLALLRPNSVLKPTTDFLQLFGKHAKKNFVQLSKEEAERFARGEDIELKAKEELENGYVIVKYKEHILGCANFKEGMLKNQLPRSRRMRIKLD